MLDVLFRVLAHGRPEGGTLQPGDSVGVEIFGELVAAEVADEVQYDPGNESVLS